MFGVNDYPYRLNPATGNDPYGYAIRQCASFANWRGMNDLGLEPDTFIGDGGAWGADGVRLGYAVDNSPRLRDLFCLPPGVDGAGQYGHVGVVLNTMPDTGEVWVEDYNWGDTFQYTQHVLSTTGAQFIHVLPEDVAMALSNDAKNGLSTLASLATLGRTTGDDGARAATIGPDGEGLNAIIGGLLQSPESVAYLAALAKLK